jgi:hypothetical protein
MLTKKLCKHGNSLALVIDRSILELLGIDEETTLDISTWQPFYPILVVVTSVQLLWGAAISISTRNISLPRTASA